MIKAAQRPMRCWRAAASFESTTYSIDWLMSEKLTLAASKYQWY